MSPASISIRQALARATADIKAAGADSPRLCSEALLARCLGISHQKLLMLRPDEPLPIGAREAFPALVARRVAREPLAYILNEKEFFGRPFYVNEKVLVPRPETEHLVEAAVRALDGFPAPPPLRVLDLGTGSGAVIATLCCERPGHDYFALDLSPAALFVAQRNTESLCPGAVRFAAGNWFSTLAPASGFAVITANPPYIPAGEIPELMPEVSDYEPLSALDGGTDGLDALRAIIGEAHAYLAPGGRLLMEMGMGQKEAVAGMAAASLGYRETVFHDDYAGIPRVAELRCP